MGLFDKLKTALSKTKNLLRTDVRDLFRSGSILDEQQLQEFEARLIQTDMGVQAAGEIIADLRENFGGRTVDVDGIWSNVKANLRRLLAGTDETLWDPAQPLSPLKLASEGPTVILVAGVNGVGKTTSIAKLAHLLKANGKRVVLAAGDTFRAAAVEQLTMWAERLDCEIVTKPAGSDPASVAFEGCRQAVDTGADAVIIDTAGRLQTQKNLMEELNKIHRVIQKVVPEGPHESLLILDATTGQNGISQARNFSEVISCTGLVLTKLDGTARGGVVIAIRQQMGFPVKYIGVGEQAADLEVFNPDSFADALFAN